MKKKSHFILKLTAATAAVCGVYLYLKDKGYITVKVNPDTDNTDANTKEPETEEEKSYITIDSSNLVEKAKEVVSDVSKKATEVAGDACDRTMEWVKTAKDTAADAAEEAAQKAADSIEKAWYSTQETVEKVEPFFDDEDEDTEEKEENI